MIGIIIVYLYSCSGWSHLQFNQATTRQPGHLRLLGLGPRGYRCGLHQPRGRPRAGQGPIARDTFEHKETSRVIDIS